MKKAIFLFVFLLVVNVLSVTSNLDPLTDVSDKLEVPGISSETFSNSQTGTGILGGERDVIIRGTGQGSSSNCASETFVENGEWFANNGQTCAAEAVLQYDGADGSGDLSMGLGLNLNNVGSAFLIDIQSDLPTSFEIEVYSSVSASSRVTQQIQSSSNLVQYTFPFGEFTGTADFSNIGAIELKIAAVINTDVIVTLFDLIANEISGRVFSDCNCNGFQDSNDAGVQGITVTATPESDCPQGTAQLTTTTNANGDYEFDSLAECNYVVSISSSNNPCTTNSRTIDTGNVSENVNFNLRNAGSISVPEDTTVVCTASTDPASTGQASCSVNNCDSGNDEDVQISDSIVTGSCDADFTIVRTFTCQNLGESGQQTIVVTDNNEAPVLSVPNDVTINCGESSDPSNTGQATATDTCSEVTITFTDDTINDCDLSACGYVGTITRTWVATDNCGLSSEGIQVINTTPCDYYITECPTVDPIDDDNCPVNEQNDEDDDDEIRFGEDDDIVCDCNYEDDDDDDSSDATSLTLNLFLIISLIFFYV
jgi:hypothetical protein